MRRGAFALREETHKDRVHNWVFAAYKDEMLPGTENQPPRKPTWIILFGIVGACVLGFGAYWLTFSARLAGMQRISIDREMTVELQPGNYVIYHETRSVVDRRPVNGAPENSNELTLFEPGGAQRLLHGAHAGGYDFGDYAGEARHSVQIGVAGRYTTARRERPGMIHFSNASTAYAFDSAPIGPATSALAAGFGAFALVLIASTTAFKTLSRRVERRLAAELARS